MRAALENFERGMAQLEVNRPCPTIFTRREDELLAQNANEAARAAANSTKLKLMEKQKKIADFQRKTAQRSAKIRAAAGRRKQNALRTRAEQATRQANIAQPPSKKLEVVPGTPERRQREDVFKGGIDSPYPSMRPVGPVSDHDSIASSSGLEIPEESELARRIVTNTEQHCILWGALQKHLAKPVDSTDELFG